MSPITIDEPLAETCTHDDHETCTRRESLRLADVLTRFRAEATEGTLDTGRYRCRYFSWGQGPAIVFIHGLCDDAQSFIMPIARLSEHFRCITYDLPQGLDVDGAHLGRYHHADLVADLFALIDHLDLRQPYLFGSSFGSTIALAAMHEQGRRFPRAILQGGFARRPLAIAEVMLASWARYWPSTMHHVPWREEILRQSHYQAFAAREPEIWQYFLDREGDIPIEAVARRALILHQTDLRHLLPSITQPVMLVCGDHDPLVGKSCERDLLEGLPHVFRAEIEGCGHIPQFTHPEVLAEIVSRFFGVPLAA